MFYIKVITTNFISLDGEIISKNGILSNLLMSSKNSNDVFKSCQLRLLIFLNCLLLCIYLTTNSKEIRILVSTYLLDVLWGQPIKLIQVASTSELRENQRNNLLFFELFPIISAGPQKYKKKVGHN